MSDRPAIITVIDSFAPREFQWCATYGEPDLDCRVGWGETAAEAIADLTEWAAEDEEDERL